MYRLLQGIEALPVNARVNALVASTGVVSYEPRQAGGADIIVMFGRSSTNEKLRVRGTSSDLLHEHAARIA